MIEANQLGAVIGGVTGVAIGGAFDMHAARRIATERIAANETWGDLYAVPGTGIRAIGPMALTGAITFGILGAALAPESVPQVPRAQLEVVVDMSGATASGEQPAIDRIKEVAGKFEGTKRAEAIVARSGQVRIVKIKDVSEQLPFGDAPLDQAVQAALDNVQRAREQAKISRDKKSATLVLTNGNGLGDPANVIDRAETAGTAISIVNVDGQTPPPVEQELQSIAKDSGGTYWGPNEINPSEVGGKISSALGSAEVPVKKPTNWAKRIRSALPLIVAMPIMYQWRRRYMAATPKGINLQGE